MKKYDKEDNTESQERLSIPQMAMEDKPREKLMLKGAGTLSDAELMGILIGSGSRKETAVALCQRILSNNHNNLNELARLTIADLCKFKGIGEAKAITILAALELGKRRKMQDFVDKVQVKSSQDVFELFQPHLLDLTHEEFWIGALNNSLKVIEVTRLSKGGIKNTAVDVTILLKYAIEKLASAIVVAHNHPSGNLFPSNQDIEITQRIKTGCDAIGIKLIDHVIIANGRFYSFTDEGKL